MSLIKIQPETDLIPLNMFEKEFPIKIRLAYADAHYPYNVFGQLYHRGAKTMWAHKDFAPVILLASLIAQKRHGWVFELLDCLRPMEAQEVMFSKGYDPDLVAPPGVGGHPRAMAVDIWPMDQNGAYIDMGVPFDFFAPNPKVENAAARDYKIFSDDILQNRKNLENVMVEAGEILGTPILPLASEWWDFRFMRDYINKFAPLSENDLMPHQRLINPDIQAGTYPPHMEKMVGEITQKVHTIAKGRNI